MGLGAGTRGDITVSSKATCLNAALLSMGRGRKAHSQVLGLPAGPQALSGGGDSYPKALLFWIGHQKEMRKVAQAQASCDLSGTCLLCTESLECPAVGPQKVPEAKLIGEHRQSCERNKGDQEEGGTFNLTENRTSYKEESDLPPLGKFPSQWGMQSCMVCP